jgi:HAAS
MDTSGMTPAAEAILNGHLAVLGRALRVGPRDRRRILAEIDDGLRCAAESRIDAGLDPAAAARAAVAEFGDPERIARQFTAVAEPALSRRCGTVLMATGPVIGLSWLSTTHGAILTAVPVVLLLLATIPAAVLAAVAGRSLAARVAAAGCVTADLTLIAAMAAHPVPGSPLLFVAVALSALRAIGSATAWHRLGKLAGS